MNLEKIFYFLDEELKPGLFSMIENSRLDEDMVNQISEYMKGERKTFDYDDSIFDDMSAFQRKVLKANSEVGYAETSTYKEMAEKTGSPGSSRAVGTALAKNPYPVIIPCHRIMGTDGRLHGYAGGLKLKEYLLKLENPEFR